MKILLKLKIIFLLNSFIKAQNTGNLKTENTNV